MRLRTIIGTTLFFCLLGVDTSHAKHLGTVGRVYPVTEPDALAEIQEAARRADWRTALDKEKIHAAIQRFRPKELHSLPIAKADKVFQVNMTYTLENNIPDGKGGKLYPKGYAFNPLEYVRLTSVLVVIDGGDKRQVDWFKRSPYAGDYHARLLLSGGDYYDLTKELDRPVFYLMDDVAKRLQLAAVPSVVRQSGKKLEVTEVLIPDE